MKKQIELSLTELATLAVEQLRLQGELDNAETIVDWHFNTRSCMKSHVVLSQEA